MIVYVLMQNDGPYAVYTSEQDAEAERTKRNAEEKARDQSSAYVRVWWSVRDVPFIEPSLEAMTDEHLATLHEHCRSRRALLEDYAQTLRRVGPSHADRGVLNAKLTVRRKALRKALKTNADVIVAAAVTLTFTSRGT